MEVISEQIKTKMDPIPEVLLKAHEIDGKKIITLEVYRCLLYTSERRERKKPIDKA